MNISAWRPGVRRFEARHLLAAITLAIAAWLSVSGIVTWRLTQRFAPIHSETLPIVEWGQFEPLRLATRDGEQLGAWLVRRPDAIGSACVLHSLHASRSNTVPLVRQLYEQRLNVLTVTLRAHGDSTGESLDFGYGSRFDVESSNDTLANEFPGQPIYLFAQSLGAAAFLYSADHLDKRVKGALLEHPYRDLRSALWHRLQIHLPPGLDSLAYAGMNIWAPVMLSESLDTLEPLRCAGNLPSNLPVVLLNGDCDRHAPLAETRQIGQRIPHLLCLIEVANSGHVLFSDAAPSQYRQAVAMLLANESESTLRTGKP